MSESQKLYRLNDEFKKSIVDYLMNPFDSSIEVLKLLEEKETFSETEINQVVSLLGKFPAYSVYPLIDQFKGNLKVEEIEGE